MATEKTILVSNIEAEPVIRTPSGLDGGGGLKIKYVNHTATLVADETIYELCKLPANARLIGPLSTIKVIGNAVATATLEVGIVGATTKYSAGIAIAGDPTTITLDAFETNHDVPGVEETIIATIGVAAMTAATQFIVVIAYTENT